MEARAKMRALREERFTPTNLILIPRMEFESLLLNHYP
jgi:hypothetical protein